MTKTMTILMIIVAVVFFMMPVNCAPAKPPQQAQSQQKDMASGIGLKIEGCQSIEDREICRINDSQKDVTCWITTSPDENARGISCIPNKNLRR